MMKVSFVLLNGSKLLLELSALYGVRFKGITLYTTLYLLHLVSKCKIKFGFLQIMQNSNIHHLKTILADCCYLTVTTPCNLNSIGLHVFFSIFFQIKLCLGIIMKLSKSDVLLMNLLYIFLIF